MTNREDTLIDLAPLELRCYAFVAVAVPVGRSRRPKGLYDWPAVAVQPIFGARVPGADTKDSFLNARLKKGTQPHPCALQSQQQLQQPMQTSFHAQYVVSGTVLKNVLLAETLAVVGQAISWLPR
jgi:hypothetical protein